MSDQLKIQKTKEVYAILCNYLDAQNWHYNKDEENFKISCGIKSRDLPIDITVKVNPRLQIINVISYVPINVPDQKRLDTAIAITAINNSLVNGNFDYDIKEGRIFYRMANGFSGCRVEEELLRYMINFSCQVIDAYNDKFLALANGNIAIDEFLGMVGGK